MDMHLILRMTQCAVLQIKKTTIIGIPLNNASRKSIEDFTVAKEVNKNIQIRTLYTLCET